MKVQVDPETCVGHGRCYTLAPELFSADDAGHSVVRQASVPPEAEQQARTAAASCPERAITVEG